MNIRPALATAAARLDKFAIEWGVLQARGTRDDVVYELHSGDPRHAVCRLSDIIELLNFAQAGEAGTAATPKSGAVHEHAVGCEDSRCAQPTPEPTP